MGFLDVAVLKDSAYNEVDRAECQFATTATVLDNDTQVCSFLVPEFSMLYFLCREHNGII